MVRTVVSLDEQDKEWLDQRAAEEGIPMTALVRRAVQLLRAQSDRDNPPLPELLNSTRGTWRHGDGLAYQRGLRDEWEQ